MTYRELFNQLDEEQKDAVVTIANVTTNEYMSTTLEFTDAGNDTLDEGHPTLLIH